MSYLLDKKIKNKKILKVIFLVFVCFILFYFRLNIFSGFAMLSHTVFRPVLIVGDNLGEKLKSLGAYFLSKNSLYLQNQKLQSEVIFDDARMSNYDSVVADNISIKEILGRKDPKTPMILSAILSKPNQSPYDTLIIDTGAKEGIKTGDTVFALGNIPIGRIAEVHFFSSKVILFSNSGEKIQVVISSKDIFMELVGRGGGNFEMIIPRDFTLTKGDQVVLPGITPYVVGIVETIISDPRDPFIKALLTSPVNIQELKFVEVETQK
jgi:cell shape-determining protein MreC